MIFKFADIKNMLNLFRALFVKFSVNMENKQSYGKFI